MGELDKKPVFPPCCGDKTITFLTKPNKKDGMIAKSLTK